MVESHSMPDTARNRAILQPEQVDDVAQAVLALARELWVAIDRSLVLEAVLARHGLDIAAEIDAHEPDPALQAKLDQRREAMLRAVTSALNRETGNPA